MVQEEQKLQYQNVVETMLYVVDIQNHIHVQKLKIIHVQNIEINNIHVQNIEMNNMHVVSKIIGRLKNITFFFYIIKKS